MKHLLTSASALALALPTGALSDSAPVDLGTLVLSASQTPVEAARTGATVEVLDEQALQKSRTTRVIDQIDRLPGVTFSGNGPTGTSSSVSVRGLPARYVPVYINGIDVTDPSSTQTAFNFGGMLTPGIGRVEVLKGSQSAIYGSNAIAGVISLNSPTLAEPGDRLTFSAEAGSYNTHSASVGYVQKTERGEMSFNLSHLKTDGFSAAAEVDGNTEADSAEITTLTFAGEYALSDTLTLGGSLFWQDSNINIDAFGGAGGDADRPFNTDRKGARLFAEFNTGAVTHTFAVARMRTDRSDPNSFFSKDFEGTRDTVEYQGTAKIGTGAITFGASHVTEKFDIDGAGGEFKIASLFVEGNFALNDRMDVSLALRGEDHSEFGSAVTARAALAYRLADATTLRASAGSGFRSPSLYELFGPYGNVALQPEKSWSVDAGVEHVFANGGSVQATLFYTEIDDLIGFSGGTYNQTPGTSKSKGLELAALFPLSDAVTLKGSYTYTDAQNASGAQLRRVPKHELTLGLAADITDQWSTEVYVSHYAKRADDGFPSRPMPDYTVVNAQVTYDITDNASAYLRIENVFDKEYQTSAGYGTSGRAAYFGVRASF